LSELRKISTNFNYFWSVGGKLSEILCDAFICHLVWSLLTQYPVKHRSSKSLLNV